jgi:hypothetical protein
LSSGRLAALGATPDFHHGLLVQNLFAAGKASRHTSQILSAPSATSAMRT